MVPSSTDALDLAIAVQRTKDTKELCAAAADVGPELTTLCFFDFLETEDDVLDLFLREVRVFSTDQSRVRKMKQSELESRLERWMKLDRNELPLLSLSHRDDAYPVQSVDVSQLRQIPIPLIERIVFQHAGSIKEKGDFIGPSNLQIRSVSRYPELLGFSGARSLKAHLVQLQAIEHYLQAATEGSLAPLVLVQRNLGVSANTARNLIQRARENGYLTSASSGKAIGKATRKARALVDKVEKTAIKIRKEDLK